jgi:hypothetical protein
MFFYDPVVLMVSVPASKLSLDAIAGGKAACGKDVVLSRDTSTCAISRQKLV